MKKKLNLKILRIINFIGSRGILNWMPDEWYIKLCWYLRYNKKLNLNNPITFSEKLQWLKINNKNNLYPILVDKIEVRKYIEENYKELKLIPILWQGNSASDIPFEKLPNKFVIKCTHGSHCNIICKDKDKLDINSTKRILAKWLKRNWFWYGREWPYKNIKPRIIIEKYMIDTEGELKDFKFFCFNGKVEFCQVISDRYENETMNFYDKNWKKLDIKRVKLDGSTYDCFVKEIKKPKKYDEMLDFAKNISSDFKFSRIDLYSINDDVYFGEITFFPANGYCDFTDKKYNEYLGSLVNIKEMVLNEK